MHSPSSKHHRSPSQASTGTPDSPLPSQTHHRSSLLPSLQPGPLFETVAASAHYSGAQVEESEDDALKHARRNSQGPRRSSSHTATKNGNHDQVMNELKQLREKPDAEIIRKRWKEDAAPSVECNGLEEILAHWFAPSTSKYEIIKTRIMASTRTPNRLVFLQTEQHPEDKTVESIITVDFDDEERIVRFSEEPSGQPISKSLPSRIIRRAMAKVATLFVRVPKPSTTEDHAAK